MKRLIVCLSFILISVMAGAQSHRAENPDRDLQTLIRLENGKYAFSGAYSADKNIKIITKTPGGSVATAGSKGLAKSCPGSTQIYHLKFHFDKHPNNVMFNGTDTVFFDLGFMTWTNPLLLEADMPEGYYDMLTLYHGAPSFMRKYVFTKNFHVYRNMDTTILVSSANHKMILELLDENHDPIIYQGLSGDNSGISFEFPSDRKMLYRSEIFLGYGDTIMFSDITPDIKICIAKATVKKDVETSDHLYHRYIASYATLPGLNADLTLMNDPADFSIFPEIFNPTPAMQFPVLSFGLGFMINQLYSKLDYFVFGGSNGDYPSHTIDTCVLFASNHAVDTNVTFFVNMTNRYEVDISNPQSNPLSATQTWASYLNSGNDLILCASGNYPTVPADCVVPDGSSAVFNSTVPFNYTLGMNSSYDLSINLAYTVFIGQYNELRTVDNTQATYDVWKGNQPLYHDSLRNSSMFFGATTPGIYSVILNDSNISLLGRSANLNTRLTFDLSLNDANPPTITSLKLLKASLVSPELIHGCDASVQFTAGDFELSYSTGIKYHGIREVQLFYKKADDLLWNALAVTSYPSLLDSINGMLYTSDLSPVLSQFADSAWVDLMIVLTDSSGNTATQTMHPAFLIRDAITGLGHIASEGSLIIFPDPAKDRIQISEPSGPLKTTIYCLSGKIVKGASEKREIDVSDLKPGLYFLKALNQQTGELFTGKFVKSF